MAETPRQSLLSIAGGLGLTVSDRQVSDLQAYLALLERWNAVYNLTAVRNPEIMRVQHVADCLAVMPPLARQLGSLRPARVLDVGSGGGLPGAVIAAMDRSVDVVCVDAVGKKTAFVRQVSAALRLTNLHALHGRVEEVDAGSFDVVTSRAFASLADFSRLTQHHLSATGVWMAMKGKVPDDELAILPGDVEVFHVEQLHVPGLAADRCLVWMRLARTDSSSAT